MSDIGMRVRSSSAEEEGVEGGGRVVIEVGERNEGEGEMEWW